MKYDFLALSWLFERFFQLLSWVFGLIFLFGGIGSVFDTSHSTPLGVALLAISFLLLPPIRNFAYSATGIQIPFEVRAVTILVLFIAFGFFNWQSEHQKAKDEEERKVLAMAQAKKAAEEQQQKIDYFNQNSAQILSQIKEAIAKEDFNGAISLSSDYLASRNHELISLSREAKTKQRVLENKKKTLAILTQLKGIPANELRENRDLYQQLVSLNPDVPEYTNKLKVFSERLKQQEEKERLAQEKIRMENERRLAQFGEPPVRSGWDGSYPSVKEYLQRIANDPDSIKMDGCTEVYHIKNGWLVGCYYRGRNAFGGIVRQFNWFTIARNRVVKMDDASAYKP
jgi:hypothetical protein